MHNPGIEIIAKIVHGQILFNFISSALIFTWRAILVAYQQLPWGIISSPAMFETETRIRE